MSDIQIIQSQQLSYFAIMPHLADDELDLYEYRLYGHYLRVCGQQNKPCVEKTRTTAAAVGFSAGKVIETRRNLAERSYISIHEIGSRTGPNRIIITLLDIWPRNIAKYSGLVHVAERGCSRSETRLFTERNEVVHVAERIKNNQYKNNQLEEKPIRRTDDDAWSPDASNSVLLNPTGSFDADHAHVREAIRTADQLFVEHLATHIGATQLWDGWSRYLYSLNDSDLERLKRWLYRFHSPQRKRWRDGIEDPVAFVRSMMDAGNNAGLSEKEKRDLREWEAVYVAA